MSSQPTGSVSAVEAAPAGSASKPARIAPPGFWLPAATLWWREIVRFYRQRSRVVGALGTPLLFWLLIGAGFGSSFRAGGGGPDSVSYLSYLFPGTILLIVLFTSIFSTISVIEDRHEGFLLSVLVAPISRSALVMGKVAGGATLALVQGLIFVLLAPAVGIRLGATQAAEVAAILFLISFAMTALGFYFAWRLDSVQGFHSVMNLVLMPMWVLSGALFPVSGAHSWIGWIMRVNPLTYGMTALERVMASGPAPPASLAASVVVVAGFALVCALASLYEVRRSAARGVL
ncbi:MAG TPA: ABC transporter permease [Bryobacterales bacterium]|nr:ABC transporter permease [Bryobacterales bacterium]